MTAIWTVTKWLLRAAIFFTLFAFALNNPHLVQLNFFFGNHWQTPVVLLVLVVFTLGVAVGALGMTPRWWRSRKRQKLIATDDYTPMPAHSGSLPAAVGQQVHAAQTAPAYPTRPLRTPDAVRNAVDDSHPGLAPNPSRNHGHHLGN